MDSKTPSLKNWIWSFKFQHFLACLIDLALWLALLLFTLQTLQHYFDFQKDTTPTLIYLIGLALLADRLMTIWPFQNIWQTLTSRDPNSLGKVAEDLLNNKGDYPNKELHDQAIEHFADTNSLPNYPWTLAMFRDPLRSLIWIIGILPIIAIDQYKPPIPETHQITIKVTPPDYLNQEEWTLSPGQDLLEVFPGTLLSVNLPKKPKT